MKPLGQKFKQTFAVLLGGHSEKENEIFTNPLLTAMFFSLAQKKLETVSSVHRVAASQSQ